MEPIAISVKDAVRTLGLSRTTIYALINQGRLDTIKLGRRTLIKMESVKRLVQAS